MNLAQLERIDKTLSDLRISLDILREQAERQMEAKRDIAELMGVREVAEFLGVKPHTISMYLTRGQIPEPFTRLACGPIWTRAQIEEWKNGKNEART